MTGCESAEGLFKYREPWPTTESWLTLFSLERDKTLHTHTVAGNDEAKQPQ